MIRVRFLDGPHEGKTGHYVGPKPTFVYAEDPVSGQSVNFAEDPAGHYFPGPLPHRYRLETVTPDGEYQFRHDPQE